MRDIWCLTVRKRVVSRLRSGIHTQAYADTPSIISRGTKKTLSCLLLDTLSIISLLVQEMLLHFAKVEVGDWSRERGERSWGKKACFGKSQGAKTSQASADRGFDQYRRFQHQCLSGKLFRSAGMKAPWQSSQSSASPALKQRVAESSIAGSSIKLHSVAKGEIAQSEAEMSGLLGQA